MRLVIIKKDGLYRIRLRECILYRRYETLPEAIKGKRNLVLWARQAMSR
jgi:hypothetical protein